MYDGVEDPYTYKSSTVLVNKLDLRDQTELDAFEAEISSVQTSHCRKALSISHIIVRSITTCSRTSTTGPVDPVPFGYRKAAIHLLSREYRKSGYEALSRTATGGLSPTSRSSGFRRRGST